MAVTFADGSTAEGDYLIGCDGIRSRVREIIDPDAAPVRYVPVLNIGGYIRTSPLDTPPDEFQMMFGTHCFFGGRRRRTAARAGSPTRRTRASPRPASWRR